MYLNITFVFGPAYNAITTLNTKTPNGQYQNLTSQYLVIKFKGRESIYINRTTVATKKILGYS